LSHQKKVEAERGHFRYACLHLKVFRWRRKGWGKNKIGRERTPRIFYGETVLFIELKILTGVSEINAVMSRKSLPGVDLRRCRV